MTANLRDFPPIKNIFDFILHLPIFIIRETTPLALSASIKLWSLPMRRCIHTFSVHTDSVWALHSTHPQLHTFFSGDRGGWICRFDVTQPAGPASGPSDTFNPMSGLPHSSGRSPTSTAFVSTHTPGHSISGTLNQLDKEREREMDLSDAYCVVIGRAGYENQSANNVNGYVSLLDMDRNMH